MVIFRRCATSTYLSNKSIHMLDFALCAAFFAILFVPCVLANHSVKKRDFEEGLSLETIQPFLPLQLLNSSPAAFVFLLPSSSPAPLSAGQTQVTTAISSETTIDRGSGSASSVARSAT